MSKLTRLLIGISTAWPLTYFILFILFLILDVPKYISGSSNVEYFLLKIIPAFTTITFVTFFILFISTIFYIRHVYRNERIVPGDRGAWVFILIIGNIVAPLIYWYIYVWKGKTKLHSESTQ